MSSGLGLGAVGRLQQQQAHETRLHRLGGEAPGLGAALAVVDLSLGKGGPRGADPILDIVRVQIRAILGAPGRGVGLAPVDAHGIDGYRLPQIDHHPLRMARVVLLGEVPVEIGIGLPEARRVPIVQAGIAVIIGLIDARAAPRQAVAVGDLDGPPGGGVGGPIAGLAVCAAEVPDGIPVPGLHRQFGAQSVAHGPEADALHPRQVRTAQQVPGRPGFVTVDAGTEGLGGDEAAQGSSREVDGDLQVRRYPRPSQQQASQGRRTDARGHRSGSHFVPSDWAGPDAPRTGSLRTVHLGQGTARPPPSLVP